MAVQFLTLLIIAHHSFQDLWLLGFARRSPLRQGEPEYREYARRGGIRLDIVGSDRAIPRSPVGGKPTSEGLASRRVARPWEASSNDRF